jgi:DNA-binding MarR family transcriptional regulator
MVAGMNEDSWHAAVGVPGLMRAARGSYASVIGAVLAEAGFDDLPRNGVFTLALLIHTGELTHLSDGLGVRKQAVGDLIDTMVMRGYLSRATPAGDAGRAVLRATARGEAAEEIAAEVTAKVNARVREQLGEDGFAAFRQGLFLLAEMRVERDWHGH